jgi:hypothetical protein
MLKIIDSKKLTFWMRLSGVDEGFTITVFRAARLSSVGCRIPPFRGVKVNENFDGQYIS